MKIAVVTNDGRTVSQHFGRSRYYQIYTIEDGKVVSTELRERGTGHFAGGAMAGAEIHGAHQDSRGRHGYGADAMRKHVMMAAEIGDCQVLIAGGMGAGAYESFKAAGLEVILTDQTYADDAVQSYLSGTLRNLYEERTD